MTSVTKTLLIRIDRMGDLILTLPVDQLPVLKDHNCSWLINEGLEFVITNSSPQRKYQTISKKFSIKNFFKVYHIIKKLNPDISISFHSPWWINLALFLNFVPLRIGVKSQWHSFLFLNKGIRQKRSQSTQHEFEYNAELVYFGINQTYNLKPETQSLFCKLVPPKNIDSIRHLFPESKNYIVVHPGMGGSALNLPSSKYIELIRTLSQDYDIVITGTILDRKYINPIKSALDKVGNIYWLNEKINSAELLTVLSHAQGYIGPSTGVTHLAASLGVATLGLYPPIKVMSATRWSPRGNKTTSVSPNVSCPAQRKCLNEACQQHPCMEKVTKENIISQFKQLMS